MGKRNRSHGGAIAPKPTDPIGPEESTADAAEPETIELTPDADVLALVGTETRADAEANAAAAQVKAVTDAIASATAFLEAAGFSVRSRIQSTRTIMPKADPDDVRAYFDSTGLARKELAAICNVTSSVISTVQNVNGDRWSLVTFGVKKGLIDAELERRAVAAAEVAANAAIAAQAAEAAAILPAVEVAQVA